MCGVTQSGKSVFTKAIQDSHEDCMTIKRDNCRMYNSEDADTVDKRFYNAVNIALKSHRYVVANDRNINRVERDKFFNNVNYNSCEVVCIWVETPQNVAVARNKNRDKYHRLSEKEIAEMYRCKVSHKIMNRLTGLCLFQSSKITLSAQIICKFCQSLTN